MEIGQGDGENQPIKQGAESKHMTEIEDEKEKSGDILSQIVCNLKMTML